MLMKGLHMMRRLIVANFVGLPFVSQIAVFVTLPIYVLEARVC